MKFASALVLFAILAFACIQAAEICDPDGNGKPDCSALKDGSVSRNFWDPTHYWQCTNSVAESVRCPSQTGFLTSAGGCVPWSEWEWVPPCPQ